MNQNVGYHRIRESGRIHPKVDEKGPKTEEIARLVPVSNSEHLR